MTGGYRQELELREAPNICPRYSYKDVGHLQGKGDPGEDHQADGPHGEGYPCGPGGGCPGGGVAREGKFTSGVEEEDESVARSYHNTVLLGKLRQAVYQATDREGGGFLLLDDQCTKIGRPVAEFLR